LTTNESTIEAYISTPLLIINWIQMFTHIVYIKEQCLRPAMPTRQKIRFQRIT
jgi:hypothetical protein